MRQALFRLAAAVVTFCAVLALTGSAAAASSGGTRTAATVELFPNGCHDVAYGPAPPVPAAGANVDWQPNCWVGFDYITNARFVAGIQIIDGDFDCNDGGRDGQFGPLTDEGVKCYQSEIQRLINHNVSVDGIVGPQTWYYEGFPLYFSGVVGENFWGYSVEFDFNRFLKGIYFDSNGNFGPYNLNCGEASLEFSSDPYPNPRVPCI